MPSIGLPPPPFGEKGIVDKIVLAGCYQVVCSVLKAVEAIVDATIINAPSSTKNADKARDPKTHQTKKGNQWSGARPQRLHCGRAPESGVSSGTGSRPRSMSTKRRIADKS